MIGQTQWSRKHWFAIIIVMTAVLTIFAMVGPGDDYKRCYTWMVQEPWRYPLVADGPWTLNPPWLAPFMAPFVAFPGRSGYILFMAFSLVMMVFTTYYLGGKPLPILVSAHMMWIMWWGQIEVWGVLAVVVGWVALQKKSWLGIFLALIFASFKPQIGFLPVLALWWWSGHERWYALAAMLGLFALSLWAWGPWPVWYFQGIFGFVGDQHAGPWNASIGLAALPLLIPALLLPLDREKRLIALTATAYIISPYMPYYSTILLLMFAVPWWAYLFGFLGYLPSLLGTQFAWNGIVLLPACVLIWLYAPLLRDWLQKRRFRTRESS